MRIITLCLLFLYNILIPCANLSAGQFESQSERAIKILKKVDDMWRGRSSHGILSMQVKTANYTRSMRMEAWSKGKEKTLVRILYPLKEKGAATLKSGLDIYSYLPQTDRTIRLTSGMMMASWMGSHFTNDDLVKESRMVDDYNAEITFEGVKEEESILMFTLMPKPEAAVVWGKIIMTVRSEDNIPLTSVYFDEDMKVVRRLTFTNIKKMGGRMIPTILRVVPEDKPQEYTELVYEDMRFDIGLEDSFFSIAQLKKM